MMEQQLVKLKNGTEEFGPLVVGTMLSLENLLSEHPIAFYELVTMCRDRAHEPFGNTGEELNRRGLLSGGRIHESTRNIVLSAVTGDGMAMQLGSPIAGGG